MKKILHMVTSDRSISLMSGQLEYLMENGFEVGVLSSPGENLEKVQVNFKKGIQMEREISPLRDFISLLKIIRYIRRENIDIINTGTPKAGLLGVLAGFINRVPNRIYTLRGLRFETEKGLKKKVLLYIERLTCLLATEVICISPSLLEEAKQYKLINKKGILFLQGSSNGINLERYPLRNEMQMSILNLRDEIGIEKKNFILGFVGRVTKDKGIKELVESFLILNKEDKNIKLLILGGKDENSRFAQNILNEFKDNDSIIYMGHVKEPEKYYYLMDLFIFPTYREGFGNVSIQAQAAGVPVLASKVTGAKDTIINNETGKLIEPYSVKDIVEEVNKLKGDKTRRLEMGRKARLFVEDNFQSHQIWNEMKKYYNSLK